ncbi:MAG TPA: isoprenylcysteine carboxylmethyltransferase family protein [Edaphobacter sp.]|nr:isoprenylcysteine carboxylmethyltransferase family protein [Edaphobacter sp.]
MKATALEFRFRYLIHAVIYVLGFTTPWNKWLHLDSIRTWQWLAAVPSRAGWLSFQSATVAVLIIGILCALIAASLRTWAAAYLDSSIVKDASMHGNQVVAAGPYRFLRNPLYVGTIIHTFALALLMPPSGALVCIILIGLFQLRLIAGEEAFLTANLGETYLAYRAKVSALIPSLTPRVAASPIHPRWPQAFLGELYMWGVVIAFAVAGWRYNSFLIIQGVVVSLGISLIARAFIPSLQANPQTKA